MKTFKKILLGLAVVVVIMLAWVGLLSMTRGTPLRVVHAIGDRSGPPEVSDPLFANTMELFSYTHIESGNRVQLLNNGNESYPPLWRDIRLAQRTLTVQLYYCQPGAVADSLARYLAERARAKVRVLLLLDAFGASPLKKDKPWVKSLTDAGVEVRWLRPVRWYSVHKANNRSHVRAIVIDGRVGYTGGFGLADYWLGDGRHDEQWRDSNVRFEGPAVMQLQAAFAAAWVEATGEMLIGDLYFPRASFLPVGPSQAGLLFTGPTTGSTTAERFMAVSIASARKTYYAANSYFVPDDDFRRLLVKAAKSGVDVRILTAGPKTDVKTTTYAGRARYPELLQGGVRIYEYQPTMMHSKTFVVDGLWSTVGSLNFDNRSLAFNNESNLVMIDAALGAQMDSIFLADLRYAREITMADVNARNWIQRGLEWGATILARML